jgi:hypothetical protein
MSLFSSDDLNSPNGISMANRINTYQVIRIIHFYSAFIIVGFLLMYIISGFLITRHNLFPNQEQKSTTIDYRLSLPAGISEENLPVYLQKEFNLRGHRGIPQKNNKGEISIFYFRPWINYLAIIDADTKMVKIKKLLLIFGLQLPSFTG